VPALLFIIGLVALFFLVAAGVLLRPSGRNWPRIATAIPCVLLGILALFVFGGLAREHYIHPPAEVFLEQLQKSADLRERAFIITDLQRHSFSPTVHEKPFHLGETAHVIAPVDAARSASYLSLLTPRVRPHDLFAEHLDVVFLFDSDGHLITWTYVIYSPSL